MEEIEIWKDIPGYEGHYQASNFGKIRSTDRCIIRKTDGVVIKRQGRLKKPTVTTYNNVVIKLALNGISKSYNVKYLIALTFIDNPYNYKYVVNIDNDPCNNRLTNLKWSEFETLDEVGMLEGEFWKTIDGYGGRYQISCFGRVRNINFRNNGIIRFVRPEHTRDGYLRIQLSENGVVTRYFIHRLVAQYFCENPCKEKYTIVNHKDENKENNYYENLEWCDYTYNNNYGTRNKRISNKNRNIESRSKKVLCVETGVLYPSAHEVERLLGYNQGNVSRACCGKTKTSYGYHWKYV